MSVLACCSAAALALVGGYALGRRQAARRPVGPAPEDAAARLEQAVAAERERIHADLHDDLGARLLQLVYRAPDAELADLARAALQDLRDVVSRTRGCSGSLLEVLGEIETEGRQRLGQAGIELDWQQPDDLPDVPLDRAQALHLFRIVREALSNVIRHAHAGRLLARVQGDRRSLQLELTDDGAGLAGATSTAGRGTENMRARAAQLQGRITWRGATAGGTRVILSFPLPQAPA